MLPFLFAAVKHPSLEPLDWTGRLKIARGVARGLAFLHETIKLPHGNLKASNVLLDCNGEPHIADFGLAPLTNNTSATGKQIAGYRAPECAQSRRMTQKVDVYAFGILILEILTGRKPTNSSDEIDLPQWVCFHMTPFVLQHPRSPLFIRLMHGRCYLTSKAGLQYECARCARKDSEV
jgi:serine/threonine protein kinase